MGDVELCLCQAQLGLGRLDLAGAGIGWKLIHLELGALDRRLGPAQVRLGQVDRGEVAGSVEANQDLVGVNEVTVTDVHAIDDAADGQRQIGAALRDDDGRGTDGRVDRCGRRARRCR